MEILNVLDLSIVVDELLPRSSGDEPPVLPLVEDDEPAAL